MSRSWKKHANRGKDVRIRISETLHLRWNKIKKNLKRLPNNNGVSKYLMDQASGINEEDEVSYILVIPLM